jgi:hypothetical protein
MALDYSPQFNPEGKNAYNNYKVVPSSNSSGKNEGGYTYKNYTTNFDTLDDLYPTSTQASERAYNLGCSGYRKRLISSAGNYQYAPCQTSAEYISIIGGIPKGDMERRYYLFDPTENVFDVTESINDTAPTGFDYKEQIFPRTLSNLIYRDPSKILILDKFQRVVFALIESVKQIKNYFNYTVPFNNRRVF